MEIITNDYGTDGKLIFCQGKPIPNSDPKSFKVVENEIANAYYFAYDAHQLYALSSSKEGLQIWTDVDIESLEFFPEKSFFADKNHLFYFNWHFIEYANSENNPEIKAELRIRKPMVDAWWNWDELFYNQLKPISFNIFADESHVFYHFKQGQNYDYPFLFGLQHDISYYSIIPNVVLQELVVLNEFYVKDSASVFHLCRKTNADCATFLVINQNFAKDKNGIWYNGYHVNENIDTSTFEIIQMQNGDFIYSFAKDKYSVFATQRSTRIGKYQGYSDQLVKLKNSDPKTFIIINTIWAKDKNNVYCYGKIWSNIDAQTFEYLFTDTEFKSRSYAKDKNNLYDANGRKTKKGIDGKHFVMLNEFWGKDNNSVFNFKTERVIKNLDAKTFEITSENGEAEDKNYKFKFVTVTHNGKDLGHKELKMIRK